MEHDRLFGVTDRRAWMLEFGKDRGDSASIRHGPSADNSYGYRSLYQQHRGIQQQDGADDDVYYYRHAEMKLAKVR
jgi:hypothetical protein